MIRRTRFADRERYRLPEAFGARGAGALGAGYTQLEQLARSSESELEALHGMGPRAVSALRVALHERGLAFLRLRGVKSSRYGQADLFGDRSLDGHVEDTDGRFEWASPDEEVDAFVDDLERRIGPTSTGAGSTTRWPSGRPRAPGPRSRWLSRFRRALAGGREDRVLPDAPSGLERENAH